MSNVVTLSDKLLTAINSLDHLSAEKGQLDHLHSVQDALYLAINYLDPSLLVSVSKSDCPCCGLEVSDYELEVFNDICSNCHSNKTPCPCPPETAKPALVAVDGGILFDNGLSIKNILCGHCLNATPEPELKEFMGWCHDCFYTT